MKKTKLPSRKVKVKKSFSGFMAKTDHGTHGYGVTQNLAIHSAHAKEQEELSDAIDKHILRKKKD